FLTITVSILFVHGIFGNRRTTWTKHGVLWPQSILSAVLPNARILTFGYDADFTKFNAEIEVTRGTIETHAADICERLAGLRARTQSVRTVIFHYPLSSKCVSGG